MTRSRPDPVARVKGTDTLAVIAVSGREKGREALRRAFPRHRGTLAFVRSRAECLTTLRTRFTDAVVVDVGQTSDLQWEVAALAREFPSIPFFAFGPHRPLDAAATARLLGTMEFADLLMEGVDDGLHRELVVAAGFSRRFAEAIAPLATTVGLTSPFHLKVWSQILSRGGRPVRTSDLATAVNLTREHLSRRFSAGGAPNLKRIIDFARLMAAAELAKNVGYDLPDIARVLGFASPSHLSVASQRVFGIRAMSLARLRPPDLVSRFLAHGTRSRAGGGVAPGGHL